MWFMKEVCQNAQKWDIYNKKYEQFLTANPTPLGSPSPPFKNPGYATVVPCTQNENSAPLNLCVVSLCVYTVGIIL